MTLSYVNETMNYIVIPETTQEHVRRGIKSLKCSAPGWDGLPVSVGKHCIDSYIELYVMLSILFTLFLRHGFSPDSIILGTMIPIPKDKKK